MKYEIATVRQLKAAVFDAIEKDVVLNRACLESFASFNSSVCDYIEYSSEPGVLSRRACPTPCTVRSWYKELLTLYPAYDVVYCFGPFAADDPVSLPLPRDHWFWDTHGPVPGGGKGRFTVADLPAITLKEDDQ